ncbi:hypothetical protein ACFYPN_15955 [Streptomyces sp. NPDC005576]|uniref:hypothetical protein n=1 Tax=Streptomyces sp. NPDC005576 TaxID=3364726 RepID=UPI0036872A7B
MNTTAAARQANVTVATIRTWARNGVIAATKTAGRWIIDTASLAHRITIGTWRKPVTEQPKYRIEEATTIQYRREVTVYRVIYTGDGIEWRTRHAEFTDRATAELHREFYELTPTCYHIERTVQGAQPQWSLTGAPANDPAPLRTFTTINMANTNQARDLARRANEHAAGTAQRIQDKAERAAIAAAETAVLEARESQLADLRKAKGDLATPRQVAYILNLLIEHPGGGFVFGYPTTAAGIEELSKAQASRYITSLKGEY